MIRKGLLGWKTLRALGWRSLGWYGLYRFGLWTGHYSRLKPPHLPPAARLRPLWQLPDAERLRAVGGDEACRALMEEAEDILAGRVRLYGGERVSLQLTPPLPLRPWTAYEGGRHLSPGVDIKDLWEPARLGWAFVLGRAYRWSGDERFAEAFWRLLEDFDRANPPYLGVNWLSGQEVALRLLALLFAHAVFVSSPHSTPERLSRLTAMVMEHAARIPPTLAYARAQFNNHHLSEALGLYAAGLALEGVPQALRWREQGWRELNHALQRQIAPDGTYCQHSVNYHRLMLHLALMADAFARAEGRRWQALTAQRLRAAAAWLASCLDEVSGRMIHLGHHDGAWILPLAHGGTGDGRPTVQAAGLAFGGGAVLLPGAWDELALWLNLPLPAPGAESRLPASPAIHRLGEKGDWAVLRAARFSSRPAHADALHVEVWHGGVNLLRDAGTFRYNAPAPWNNGLAGALAHNSVIVDGREPMTRAGRFLWLDWDHSWVTAKDETRVTAVREGYLRLGILHQRTLERVDSGRWLITDRLLPYGRRPVRHAFALHFLLPDWHWQVEGEDGVLLEGEGMQVRLRVQARAEPLPGGRNRPLIETRPALQIIRAGEALWGEGEVPPVLGWFSPTYGVREPALTVRWQISALPPLALESEIVITGTEQK